MAYKSKSELTENEIAVINEQVTRYKETWMESLNEFNRLKYNLSTYGQIDLDETLDRLKDLITAATGGQKTYLTEKRKKGY